MERLDEAYLKMALGELPLSVYLYSEIDSTNSQAKRHAMDGGTAPAVFLAESQSGGRGRMGRSFYSPAYTGIYLSLLFQILPNASDTVLLTTAASVAVLRAIRSVTGIEAGIKWVNDLYVEGRKVCGILAESFFCGEERYGILGVGINLDTAEFPEALRETAGSLNPQKKGLRNALAAEVIQELYGLVKEGAVCDFIEEYRAHSMVLGQAVVYTQNQETKCGVAEAIDERGRLLVRHEDGTAALLASGEISLRLEKQQEDKGDRV